ncbi:MAG TPA: hypothetical protein PKH77_09615 [Anaerolineae bacterium]|nr:hypothetical protein [Anaerolineae bacterium]
MHCPKCRQPNYRPDAPCPYCGFETDPVRLEELTHIRWLLRELESWHRLAVPEPLLKRLQNSYTARQRTLEIELGLRRRPFTAEEAATAWPRLFRDNVLLEYLDSKRSYLNPIAAQPLQAALRARRDDLLDGLAGRPAPADPTDADRLDAITAVLKLLDDLRAANAFATPDAELRLRPPLLKEQERLEIALGRRKPEKAKEAADERISGSADRRIGKSAVETPAPAAPKPPPTPLMERLWRTPLSERTLNALLFLGIFLIFAAAISFVVWGWESFSAPLRVAIPTGFTALFFALGWGVRTKTRLYNSGIAMSAIGALLIPVDFYTLYKSFHISPDVAPEFWLMTSLVCLGAYLGVVWIIQNRIFGYLVGFASVGVAWFVGELLHKFAGMPYDWTWAGPSLLTSAWVVVARALARRKGRFQVLVDPLRALALLVSGVLMVTLLGLRLLRGPAFDALHDSLTVAWAIGGLVLGWGAWFYRSRGLWMAAVTALPAAVYLAQAALFHTHEINGAWHALGWALLTPLYVIVGHRLARGPRAQDPVGRFQAQATNIWAILLILTAALWSLTDLSSGTAAACSHAILAAAVTLAALLWQRPAYLYGASALSLTAATFAMSELTFPIAQLSVGWASLALAHVLLAYFLGQKEGERGRQGEGETVPPSPPPPLTPSLSVAGYVIAALALLPTLWPFDADLCAYVLGNWVGLAAWGAWLAHQGRLGFVVRWPEKGLGHRLAFIAPESLFHWLTAIALPFWVWALSEQRRPAGLSLTLALAALAWGMVALSYRLERVRPAYRRPWYVIGLLVSVVAPTVASYVAPDGFAPTLCVLSAGILYFADAITRRQPHELAVAAWATAGGVWLFLDRFNLTVDALTFAIAVLVAAYLLVGLWVERRRSPVFTHTFLTPLYLMSHALALAVLTLVYWRPLMATALSYADWTEVMQQWGGATQLLLGAVYGLYAWGTYRERWGHAAAWLGVAGAGFLVIAYSQGRGSSAAKAALIAIAFVLAERALHALTMTRRFSRRARAALRLAWPLYRRPLLVAGWTVSVGAIGLALIRNLWLLGGGRERQLWAVAGLLLITGLYALSARLFRRARFVTFAAILVFAPWTILTDLGWFTSYRLTTPGFAASWVALAWVLFLLNRLARRFAPDAYALPLRVVAHVLLPLALLWGIADAETSRVTMGMAVAYYALAAWLDYWDARRASRASTLRLTRFAYPALGLIPVWCVHLLAWHLPQARHELYGWLLMPFGALGLAAGHWLRKVYCSSGSADQRISESADQRESESADQRIDAPHNPQLTIHNSALSTQSSALSTQSSVLSPQSSALSPQSSVLFGLPAYLTGYLSVIVGTLLTAHIAGLLTAMLLYDALLLLLSAYVFRDAVWDYPAAGLAALSLLIALNEAGTPGNRHGWWLIGLAALYFALAWLLRRIKLDAYAAAPLAVGFVVLALGLPPSSEDQIGALWGYGSAALLYGVTAFWLKQPLLLMAASGLAVVPYVVSLQRSIILPEYYGLMLLPGAVVALALGRWLDAWRGAWRDFPWTQPARWPAAFVDRVLGWWALPFYTLGFGLGLAAPFVTAGRIDLATLNCLLLIPLCAWAIATFRRRGWLLALAVAAHGAALLYLKHLGWWTYPTWLWAQLLPLTLLTTGAALWIERRRNEGPPLNGLNGWQRITSFAALRLCVKPLLVGWSRPLYLVACFDMLMGQLEALNGGGTEVGALLSLTHALVIGGLATVWRAPLLPYLSTALGVVALERWWDAHALAWLRLPVWFAVLAFGYGAVGFGMTLWRNFKRRDLPARLAIWRLPLQNSALTLSAIVLVIAGWPGLQVAVWTLMATFGFSFRDYVDLDVVQAVVGVLSWLGLLYVAATTAYRRARLGYAAVGMLLAGWLLYAFFIREWTELLRVQWYAIPAGVYLLGVGYMEWRRGNRALARWIDYGALFLLIASLFWQTLRFGWLYALMLGAEGFLLMGFGSARRVRRLFYAGMLGVMLATLGQFINALQDVNQWIVFGLIGILSIGLYALAELKLGQIKTALREVQEDWE